MHYGSTARGTCCMDICTYNCKCRFPPHVLTHEIGVEKNIDTVHHLYTCMFVSQRGVGVEGGWV